MERREKIDFGKGRTFSLDRCFVCDDLLTDENSTEEHIYPKWLQKKFNLYNQKIRLLNGTFIHYRNLKVPCCKDCNCIMSQKIENPMRQAVEGGYDSFINLDRQIVFQWLNKLSYGMLYKETMLLLNRKRKEEGYIIPHEVLNELHMKYIFLVSTVKDTEYILNPYSLLIFRIKPDTNSPYWVCDGFPIPFFCMALNEIGIIAHLQDNKYNEDFLDRVIL